MKVLSVVGARPNLMKIAPLLHEMRKHRNITSLLVHTGQHYDFRMSEFFFRQLRISKPDVNLRVHENSHVWQISEIMRRLEPLLRKEGPDVVVVVGDVNSTFAAAFAASKVGIPVAHVEAGLRSFDRSMPEEVNRVLTDQLAQLHFVTEPDATRNLLREGISRRSIFLVGNVMVDTLLRFRRVALKSRIFATLGLRPSGNSAPFGLVTLHRPSNVDQRRVLANLLGVLNEIARELPVFLPMHPRTEMMVQRWGLQKHFEPLRRPPEKGLYALGPLGYLDFLALMQTAKIVLTDSGGIQEETTVLRVPCLTLRENTERPITVTQGTNHIVGTDPAAILRAARAVLRGERQRIRRPKFWDGKSARRIVRELLRYF